MKLTMLQLSRGILSLTPVKSGRRAVFGVPQSFELPQSLRGSGAFSDLPALAGFVRQCVLEGNFTAKNILLCLEDDNVVSKEYQHLPCKPKNLLPFARLEAESVLSDSVDDYLIQNYEYGFVNELTGKLTSALFAVPVRLVNGIRRAFAQQGMKVVKIVPPMGGLLYAVKAAVKSAGQTVAVLDLGFEKTRLLVVHDGHPIYQRTFEGIFDDIVEITMTDRSVPFREAAELARGFGLNGDGAAGPSPEAMRRISTLLDASANEAVRNIRMVLSSERLELNRIVLCGAMSVLPNYSEFWNSLGLDVPLETVGAVATADNLPGISPQARRAELGPAAFFSAYGLLRVRKSEDLDFLNITRAQTGSTASHIAALAVLTLLACGVMALEPLLYSMKAAQIGQDQKALSNPAYSEIQSLQNRQSGLSSSLSGAKAEQALLPNGKSKAGEDVKQLLDQVAAKATLINSCTVDNTSGNVSLSFSVKTYDDYLAVKHTVESNGYFEIAVPFSAVRQDDGTYLCTAALSVKDFTPWSTNSKGGAGK